MTIYPGIRHTEIAPGPVIDVLFGHTTPDVDVKNSANITVDDLARQMATSGPLSELLTGASETTMAGLIQALELENNQEGYETALAYFLDHPTLHKLAFGAITFLGAFEHDIAEAACDKTLDLTGATLIPAEEEKECMTIRNTVLWIEEVTSVVDGLLNITETDPTASQSTVTYLTLANPRTITRGDVLKIFSLDRLPNVNQGLDGEGIKRERSGELIMGVGSDEDVIVMNGRLRETYGGAGYEGSIRLAAYSMRKFEMIGGHGKGNPIGIDTWRGWGHTSLLGFHNLIVDRFTMSDCYGSGLSVGDCWQPHVYGFRARNFSNSRVSTGLNRYGYALCIALATRGAVIVNPVGTNCRHLIDTTSASCLGVEESLANPWQFGVSAEGNVYNGSAIGLSNAPWGCHHNVRGLTFHDCFVADTFVGDDSGGLALASRGIDVHFKRMTVKSTRNAGALGGIKGGSFEGCDMVCGWNGILVPCAEGMFACDNRIELQQIFNDGAMIAISGAYVGQDGLTYPGSKENPITIGAHHIVLKGNGAVGSPRIAILRFSAGAHIRIDGDIFVDMTQYDGDVTVAEFDWGYPYTSVTAAPGVKIIVKGGSCTGNIYRIIEPTANEDMLITSLTRSGTTVTCLTNNSRLDNGMAIRITGSAQDEYNGRHENITWIEGGFTFELEEGVEPATPATSSGAGIYFRRYLSVDWDVPFEYFHDTTAVGGNVDQYIDYDLLNLPWKQFTAGAVTRDTADFNFTGSTEYFALARPADDVTNYAVGGTGGVLGLDISAGIAPRTQTLTLRNAATRALQWTEPKLFLPPKASVTLKGGKNSPWIRTDIPQGENLIFGGFVDLNVAGDQPLLPAMDIGASGWRWNFTRAVIANRSGGFEPAQCVLTAAADYTDIDLTDASGDQFSFDIVHYRISFLGQVQEVRLPVLFARGGDDSGNDVYAIWEAVIAINDQLDAAGMDITCSSSGGTRLVLTSDAPIRGASEIIQIENIVATGANTAAADLGIAEGEFAAGTGCIGGIFQLADGAGQAFVAGNTDLSDVGNSHLITIPVDAGRNDPFYGLRSYTDQVLYFRMLADYEAPETTLCDVYVYGNLI